MTSFTKRPGFERETTTPSSFLVQLAEQEIFNTYGDTVSVLEKGKTLLKFGRNSDLDSAARETIWNTGGNETYVSTNAIDTISSSNAGDTQEVYIEGHTVTGTGVNQQFTFVSQTATLNGQNKVVLSTPLARVSRAYDNDQTTFSGDIRIYEDTAITGGVPSDATKVHLTISGSLGDTQSFKCSTTFSNIDYFICTGGFASVERATAALVDFRFEVRRPGGVFRPVSAITLNSNGSGFGQVIFNPYVIIPKNSDIRVTAQSSTNNVAVDASFQGFLAKVV